VQWTRRKRHKRYKILDTTYYVTFNISYRLMCWCSFSKCKTIAYDLGEVGWLSTLRILKSKDGEANCTHCTRDTAVPRVVQWLLCGKIAADRISDSSRRSFGSAVIRDNNSKIISPRVIIRECFLWVSCVAKRKRTT